MRPTGLLGFAGALTLRGVDALMVVKRDQPAVFALPFERTIRSLTKPSQKGFINEPLENHHTPVGAYYSVNFTLGTPPQTFFGNVDTGSSDILVETTTSDFCTFNMAECVAEGTYNANKSSTYSYLKGGFFIEYADASTAHGDWATDVFGLGNSTIKDLRFGIMYKSTTNQNMIGLSFKETETQVHNLNEPTYDNLPVLLVKQGYIESRAYSIFLNDDLQKTGQILFGGVDTEKYLGELVTIPLVPVPGTKVIEHFFIPLRGMTVTAANGTELKDQSLQYSDPVPAVLDTGTSAVFLDHKSAAEIRNAFGLNSIWDSIDCSMASTSAAVNFQFDGMNISVPIKEFIYERTLGSGRCDLFISGGGSTYFTLGVPFLSSTYAVFDLDNKEISLAPANWNSTGKNILQITKGKNGVSRVKGGSTSTSSSATKST
ncbi:aspartic peptidase domain-containing protein [Halenospora varia]|nr:aspartic peptidase domain-containing protein [Halenospora varia]